MTAPEEENLLATTLAEAQALSALTDRIARSRKLLRDFSTSAPEFLQHLDADELEFFLSCPRKQLRAEVTQWLGMMSLRPETTYVDRQVRVRCGYGRRYDKTGHALSRLDALELRLRTVFMLRRGVIRWEPYDTPQARVEEFLAWFTPAALEWALGLPFEDFRTQMRASLEKYDRERAKPRPVGAPLTPLLQSNIDPACSSSHSDEHVQRLAKGLATCLRGASSHQEVKSD